MTDQMKKEGKPLIILTGPTAVGKTSLSIGLANAVNGEIISADSMQVYKHMDIGSAKITNREMQGIKHYLIDVLDPKEDFNVYIFQKLCRKAMDEIYAKGKIPVLVGGTGFYIQAILRDIEFTENEDETGLRKELEALAADQGPAYLHNMLKEIDPKSAESIHPNNIKRMIRALEYYRLTGQKISEHNDEQRGRKSPYKFCLFVLNDDRKKLYERIDKRVDLMKQAGLLDEVKWLKENGCTRDMISMQGLGYKELLDYLAGEISLDEATEKIKLSTRHFAKRQLTWFRREQDTIWIDKRDFKDEQEILEVMKHYMKQEGIL